MPTIGAIGLTVIECVEKQPAPKLYVILATPIDTPVTKPELTESIELSLLLHMPPAGVIVSVVLVPAQSLLAPTNAEIGGRMETIAVTLQPVDNE